MAHERPPYGFAADDEPPRTRSQPPARGDRAGGGDGRLTPQLRGSQGLADTPARRTGEGSRASYKPASVSPNQRDWRTLAERASADQHRDLLASGARASNGGTVGGWPQQPPQQPPPQPPQPAFDNRQRYEPAAPRGLEGNGGVARQELRPAAREGAPAPRYGDAQRVSAPPPRADQAMAPRPAPPDDPYSELYAQDGSVEPAYDPGAQGGADAGVTPEGYGDDFDYNGTAGLPDPQAMAGHPHEDIRRDDVQQGVYDDLYEENEKPKRRRPAVLLGMLAGVAVIAGMLIFAYQYSLRGDSAGVPTVEAEKSPAKVAPDDPGGVKIPQQTKLIYDRIVGDQVIKGERIVPREESVRPVSPAGTGERSSADPAAGGQNAQGGGLAAALRNVVPGGGSGIALPSTSGTVIPATSTKGAVETSPLLPPGSTPPATRLAETAKAAETAETAGPSSPPPSPAAADNGVPPVPKAKPRPPRAVAPPAGKPRRVASGPVSLIPTARAAAPTAPARAPRAAAPPAPGGPTRLVAPAPPATTNFTPARPAAAAPAASGSYVVQVAALRSKQEAESRYAALKRKHAGLLTSYNSLIQRATIPDKGVYYRLRIGPLADKAAASRLCSDLRARGESACIVTRL